MNELLKLFNYDDFLNIIGLTKELNSFYIVNKKNIINENILVVTSSLYEANKYYELISAICDNVYFFPMDDFINTVALATSPELKVKRLETLNKIKNNKNCIVVTNLMGYLKFLPSIKSSLEIKIKKGDEINKENLEKKLIEYGYKKESIVTSTGEFASRGFIIDIFLPFFDNPVRLEFFGNNIEEIKIFNPETQLSFKKLESVLINNFNDNFFNNLNSNLYDYLSDPYTFFINYDQILTANNQLENEIVEYKEKEEIKNNQDFMFQFNNICPKKYSYISEIFDNKYNDLKNLSYKSKTINNFNGNFSLLKEYVLKEINEKKYIVICINNKNQKQFLQELFVGKYVLTNLNNLILGKVNLVNCNIYNGFEINNYIFIGQYDIEKTDYKKTNYKNIYKIGHKIKDYADLSIGDYVVHYNHGIGVYNGIKTLKKNGIDKDYLQIIYKNDDKIYVPVEKIDNIFKYSDKDGAKPSINSLSSSVWIKTKKTLTKKIKDISSELLEVSALRKASKCVKFLDFPEENLFANDFPYEETIDQSKAIDDILNDLRSDIPMDRLLCGDVGFGKTEVAFRGIFKSIINGFQVAYLCPTTILSSQQYTLACERFTKYGIKVALLNRFVTSKNQKETIDKLANGEIDFVIGTHRLLSDDIKFKNLGLLVIDEEQRFGVTHKEKIKKLKNNVNVLTMTATPIPRTLKMAISGLRDLSIIDTPPVNRYPIQTYVIKENDSLIKDAIYKELARNGQVFILYNSVQNIIDKANQIKKLVPEADIQYAHGQMTKIQLENIMQDFIDNKFNILICTTIIETGIDIPNSNTLIIYNADHFGLSQLYQIRGRVGRSNRIAYAYLLYNKNKELNNIAVKRLQAIKEFTELGSGYKIAMRDISIRGSGDILGSQQAGFVDTVGLELYMKLVNNELKRLQGKEVEEINCSDQTILNVDTHIQDEYVDDSKLKIEIHKKINEINSYNSLVQIKNEIEDRFGKIDEKLNIYMYEEWLEKILLKNNITNVTQNNNYIEIELPENTSNEIEGDKLLILSSNLSRNFQLSYKNNKIYIRLNLVGLEKHFIYYLIELFTKLFPGK